MNPDWQCYNDGAGVTVSALSASSISEDAGSTTFTVVLNTQPSSDVTIGVSSSDTGVATVSPASLSFTSANYGTAQTVTVTAVDNAEDASGDGSVTITVDDAASAFDVYNSAGFGSTLTLTVADDDDCEAQFCGFEA